ncbi:MAG: hypothetical protein RLZZ59_260 [Pseudomonadota bacterium]|jgi:uncharacterized protein (UPF0335 family)
MSTHAITKEHLQQIIGKLERLEQEKANAMEDIREACAEAKANGFDVPTIKKIMRIRKMDEQKRIEQEELLDLYMGALGM